MAKADTISFSASHPMSTTNWTDALAFPKFDPSLGTLTGIHFHLQGGVEGQVEFENMDSQPATVRTFLQAEITLYRPDRSIIILTIPVHDTIDNVTAFDGVLDFGGTSGRSYLGLTASDSSSADSPPPESDIALFTGPGTIALPIHAVGTSFASGAGNLIAQFSTSASALVGVTYIYEPPPPPTGACCDPATGACTITAQSACLPPLVWLGPDVPCNTETCVPPTPTDRSSWGRIKNRYR